MEFSNLNKKKTVACPLVSFTAKSCLKMEQIHLKNEVTCILRHNLFQGCQKVFKSEGAESNRPSIALPVLFTKKN